MFKLLTFIVLAYLGYKVFFPAPKISAPQEEPEEEWIDYEEID
jgi:hypothetical protein